MRLLCFLTAVVLLISMTACQTGKSSTDKQIAKSLDEINKKLSTLNKELDAIKKELVKPETTKPLPKKPVKRVVRKGPDFRRLRKIKLAENPSRKQVEEYIKKIVAASKGQNYFTGNDPQIAMLCKVGPENIDLLIDNSKDNHVNWALNRLVTEKNKKQILEAFKNHPGLISCVRKYGWAKEAKTSIYKYIKNGRADPSPQLWIAAAVHASSPKEYAILEDYFARAGNPEMIYGTLNQLEDFDMKKAIAKGWANKKLKSSSYTKGNMAIIAARYGHKDALEYMVHAKEKNQYLARKMMTALFQLTGKSLSPKAMERWYKENEKNLVFDPENEEYIIKAKPVEKNLRNP